MKEYTESELAEKLMREHIARDAENLMRAKTEDFDRTKAEIQDYDRKHPEDCTFGMHVYHVRDGRRAYRTFDHEFSGYELRNVHGARLAVNFLRRWGVAYVGVKFAGHWQIREGRRVVAEA